MKTSHKQNRPFDFKLINLVEPNPVLYQRQIGLSTYESMKAKNEIWKVIAEQMNSDVDFCISRWSNLRGQFQKELRHCRYLCPKLGIIKGSTWPYLERLKFLESTVQFTRPQRVSMRRKKPKKLEEEARIWHDDSESSPDDDLSEIKVEEHMEEDIIENVPVEMLPVEEQIEEHIEEQITEQIVIIDETPKSITLNEQLDCNSLMLTLMEGLNDVNRARVERRIMAFLCKCQLRALFDADINDLVV